MSFQLPWRFTAASLLLPTTWAILNTMARITSDRGEIRSMSIRWPDSPQISVAQKAAALSINVLSRAAKYAQMDCNDLCRSR